MTQFIIIMRAIISRNPYTGQILEQLPFTTDHHLSHQLLDAAQGYQLHRKRTTKDRANMIGDLIPLIQSKRQELSKLITFETGQPIVESQFQVAQALKVCRYYSKHREALLPMNVKTEAKKKTLIKYLPQGTVYCVLPSQYPFLLNFYKTLPQLMIGNGVLVKHSHRTPRVGKVIQKILRQAGFESGEYQLCWNDYSLTQSIISNQQICGVSFTGSRQSGAKIAQMAGKHLKKVHLSTDFQSTLILLSDGSVTDAVANIFKEGFFRSGLGIGPRRFVIQQSNYEKFRDAVIQKLKDICFGNPEAKSTIVGPLPSPTLHSRLVAQLSQLPSDSRVIFQRAEMSAPFFPLTVVQGSIFCEGLSDGPIFQLLRVRTNEECFEMANRMRSTSASFIFSTNKWTQLVDDLLTGCVFVNTVSYFDPHAPLGQANGLYSREGSYEGIRSLCNIKTSFIN